MPKLKAVLDNLDDVAEGLKELYTEKDGKYILDVEEFDNHPVVVGLKNALAAQKTARAKQAEEIKVLKEKVATIPEDYDPEEIVRLRTQIEELESDPAKKGMTDKDRQELVQARKLLEEKIKTMEKNHATEVEKLNKQLEKKSAFIGQLLVDDGLTKALVEAGVGKEYLKASKALLRQDVKVIEEDDDYRAVVETDTGQLDVQKYVSDWVASDEGKVFVPPAKGGDAGGTSKPAKPVFSEKNPWSKDHWNLTEQGKLLKADRAKAEKLAKAAGQKLPEAAA